MLVLVALRKESVDRNMRQAFDYLVFVASLSARRAWIEICPVAILLISVKVALRKESVDRNWMNTRKKNPTIVALRKESVDRNYYCDHDTDWIRASLSARRAWIEIDETT